MRVALACDWLISIGGAERVLLELHKLYPNAPIYTSQYDPKAIDWFNDAKVQTGWLQKLPKSLRKFLPILRAWYFHKLDLSDYDLVISSSGAEAKGLKTGPKTIHICYMHAPTHYYWLRHDEYLEKPGFPVGLNWLARLSLKLLVGPLKRWDKQAAQKPDYIITNSDYTKDNIQKFYRRPAEVIHPPVEIDRFKIKGTPPDRHGLVIAGRQTPYKRFDLAIEAANQVKVPLVVIGEGPDHRRLEKLAGRSITFLTGVNDFDIVNHFQSSVAFIMPNADDFGIVAVEAMAAGTPVISYSKGGQTDYISPGKTGTLFDRQTVRSLAEAINKTLNKNFNHLAIAQSVDKYSVDKFRLNIKHYIKQCLDRQASLN